MATATAKLNALLNLKKVAQIWAKRVVIPGWTKEKLIEAAVQRRLYKTKSAASKVSNATLATQLGIDPTTGESKQKTDKPATQTKKTTTPEIEKETKLPATDDFEKMKMPELRKVGAQYGVKGKGKAELIRKLQEVIKKRQEPEKKEEPKKETTERQEKIGRRLGIKPVNQGQLHIDNLPDTKDLDVSAERIKTLQSSMEKHGTNLLPVVLRRTGKEDEGQEYEVIDGGDWIKAARDSGKTERLQVTIVDTDDVDSIKKENDKIFHVVEKDEEIIQWAE